MAKSAFSLKTIRRMILGLGWAAGMTLIGLMMAWDGPQFSKMTIDQGAIVTGLFGILLWLIFALTEVDRQEKKIEAQIRELQKGQAA